MNHFNKLTPAEAERLALLSEELGEVQQIIGKILRHGYESYHPADKKKKPTTNRQLLEKEIGDVSASVLLMTRNGDIMNGSVAANAIKKLEKVEKYLHHNKVEKSTLL